MTEIKRSRPAAGTRSLDDSVRVRKKRNLIQWPTEEELDNVSAQLKRISQIGIASEGGGDYFTSGDLAYQLHEIMRTTSELLKRSVRNERQ